MGTRSSIGCPFLTKIQGGIHMTELERENLRGQLDKWFKELIQLKNDHELNSRDIVAPGWRVTTKVKLFRKSLDYPKINTNATDLSIKVSLIRSRIMDLLNDLVQSEAEGSIKQLVSFDLIEILSPYVDALYHEVTKFRELAEFLHRVELGGITFNEESIATYNSIRNDFMTFYKKRKDAGKVIIEALPKKDAFLLSL